MSGYQRPRPSAASEARRLAADQAAFSAQASVYRRLMDLLEDELHAAERAGLAMETDVLRDEVDRLAGLVVEMTGSADHAQRAMDALAAKVAG